MQQHLSRKFKVQHENAPTKETPSRALDRLQEPAVFFLEPAKVRVLIILFWYYKCNQAEYWLYHLHLSYPNYALPGYASNSRTGFPESVEGGADLPLQTKSAK